MEQSRWNLLLVFISGSAATFLLGKVGPWLFDDFANSCRAGSDAARAVRRKLEEIQRHVWPVVKSLERVTTSTNDAYGHFTRADVATDAVEVSEADLLRLRDDKLQDDIEACLTIVRARIRSGHMTLIPAINQDNDLENPEGRAHAKLKAMHHALKDLDIPACSRLINALAARSHWAGFAWHRIFKWKPWVSIAP